MLPALHIMSLACGGYLVRTNDNISISAKTWAEIPTRVKQALAKRAAEEAEWSRAKSKLNAVT